MQINLEATISSIITRLEKADYSDSRISAHRRCYDALQSHFAATGNTFTMEESIEWLENRKSGWSYAAYCSYRSALFRLERYLLSGRITRTMCFSVADFACRDAALKLPESLYILYCEFKSILSEKYCETSGHCYSQGCKDFLLFIAEQGCTSMSKMTIDPIIAYANELYAGKRRISGIKTRWLAGIVNLLSFLAERGDIPYCYSAVLPRNTATFKLLPLKLEVVGAAFQPSKNLEPLVPKYLSSLDGHRYSNLSKALYTNDFTNFFLFLELNHLEYSRESIEIWLDKHTARGAIWERKRHTLTLFADYLSTGSTNKESCYGWQPLQIDSLPDWRRNTITGFLAERQREGLAKTTLTMCRSAGFRFFSFLVSKGICSPQEITPEIVKEFHNTDKHSTPESKNAYGIKTRQLLLYMAEHKLVQQNLFLAVSTQCAPCRNIVSVMSAEMESAVYQYRVNAAKPLELRNVAIVMLGLRMGMRASDIVNLKISNFNWQKRTVSFIQQKTDKAITLPVPIDAGNSVFKYVMDGRPQSGAKGDGYVFIRHSAPFARLKSLSNISKKHADDGPFSAILR